MKMLYLIMLMTFVSFLAFVGCSGGSSPGTDAPLVTDAIVDLSVEIGESDSRVSVPNSIKGSYSLYTSSDADCDIASYDTCADAEFNSLKAGTTATLSHLTESTTKDHYFVLVNANNVSVQKTLSFQLFSGRGDHQVAVLGKTMYLIGGQSNNGAKLNDVWSSTDGATWKQITASATFSGRSMHQVAVLGSTMYLIGGLDGNQNDLNDVWSSTDGAAWTKVPTDSPSFPARYGHQVAVLDDTMYLIGGYDNTDHLNDVWSSTDGKTWKEVKANGSATGFSARRGHQIAVLGDTMYLIDGVHMKGDVWSSTDGATWNQVTASADFPGRIGHQVAVVGKTMYLIGGSNTNYSSQNDVWSSTDGKTWKEVKADDSTGFPVRYDHQVAVLGNTMYLISGNTYDNTKELNDVWSSTDGATWRQPPHVLSFDYQ